MRNIGLTLMALSWAGSCLGADTAATKPCSVKSGTTTVALLELYTSEGCSSCPPADEWLAALAGKGIDKSRVVPLALHVDYWDDLGWKDPFSQKDFTRRQYRYAQLTGARTVYTPQFLLNGKSYSGWRKRDLTESLRPINQTKPRADIELNLLHRTKQIEVSGSARVTDHQEPRRAEVYLALYENNLTSQIRAGENSGQTLHHDFVTHRLIGPIELDATGAVSLKQNVKLEAGWNTKNLGVAAFVQDRQTGDVLQALALPLCQ